MTTTTALHEVLQRAVDTALPDDGTVARMHQRGRLAITIAEYGRLAEEAARAEAPTDTPDVERLRDRIEGLSRMLHGWLHDGDDDSWGTCALQPCATDNAAPAQPAPAGGTEHPWKGSARRCPACGARHGLGERRPATPRAGSDVERRTWTVVQGEDDDCGVCGRGKVRWVDPEYEPGGLRCTECDWFQPHPPTADPHDWSSACGMSCNSPAPVAPDTRP